MGLKYKVLRTKKTGAYLDTIGLIGEVLSGKGGYDNIPLVFKEIKNDASSYGAFYYEESEIEIYEEEKMERKECYLEPGYMVVMVRFLDGLNAKLYNYACYDQFKKGQLAITDKNKVVIIEDGMTLEECESRCFVKPLSQLKCVIDEDKYQARVEKANKKQELKKKMDERVKQLQKEQIYELFAEKDDSLKALLDEYKAI